MKIYLVLLITILSISLVQAKNCSMETSFPFRTSIDIPDMQLQDGSSCIFIGIMKYFFGIEKEGGYKITRLRAFPIFSFSIIIITLITIPIMRKTNIMGRTIRRIINKLKRKDLNNSNYSFLEDFK